MADTRKTPDAHEGPRAISEERWEKSAQAERRLDELTRDGVPPRDAAPSPPSTYGDENLPPELKQAVHEDDETIAEQSRAGMEDRERERT
ncbi:hypothetical protein JQX13_21955 [Archangium violaceum]|uniref:hypothetical protein n=1 Tax=Archangium violaceum TaxID=83451 RepID=UPI00193BD7FC|nr:hypothetical protein [Archangium violaceum]QRK12451.1 hypothetical protein JQX13_21955 [Archangium violaceum]